MKILLIALVITLLTSESCGFAKWDTRGIIFDDNDDVERSVNDQDIPDRSATDVSDRSANDQDLSERSTDDISDRSADDDLLNRDVDESDDEPEERSIFADLVERGSKSYRYKRCKQSKKKGSCHSKRKRYYYNIKKQKCVKFKYSGCGGNTNNFITKSMCKMICKKCSKYNKKC